MGFLKHPEMNFMLRIKTYLLQRLLPISLLWGSIGAAALLVPRIASVILPEDCRCQPSLDLKKYVDEGLLVVIFVGVLIALAVLSLIDRIMQVGAAERENIWDGVSRLWDELSSACTHVGLGTLVLGLASPGSVPWIVVAYLAIAAFTFRLEATGVADSRNMVSTGNNGKAPSNEEREDADDSKVGS